MALATRVYEEAAKNQQNNEDANADESGEAEFVSDDKQRLASANLSSLWRKNE